jgi:hypothetical protein
VAAAAALCCCSDFKNVSVIRPFAARPDVLEVAKDALATVEAMGLTVDDVEQGDMWDAFKRRGGVVPDAYLKQVGKVSHSSSSSRYCSSEQQRTAASNGQQWAASTSGEQRGSSTNSCKQPASQFVTSTWS